MQVSIDVVPPVAEAEPRPWVDPVGDIQAGKLEIGGTLIRVSDFDETVHVRCPEYPTIMRTSDYPGIFVDRPTDSDSLPLTDEASASIIKGTGREALVRICDRTCAGPREVEVTIARFLGRTFHTTKTICTATPRPATQD